MINNRQAGRRRGRNNPRQNGSGGNRSNSDNGNRIDNRARGNATQLLEKYRNMARDAQMAGDRVSAESYLQYADHYFRVLADNRMRQEEQQSRYRRDDEGDQNDQNDQNDDYGDDGDVFGDASDIDQPYEPRRAPYRPVERPAGADRQRAPEQDRQRIARDDNQDRQRIARDDNQDRQRIARDDNQDRARPPRDDSRDRPRPARDDVRPPREDGARAAPRQAYADLRQPNADNASPSEAPAAVIAPTDEAPARPRRGRPRRVVEDVQPGDGDNAPASLDAAILPPSIARPAPAAPDGDAEAPPRPRRGRPPRAVQAAE